MLEHLLDLHELHRGRPWGSPRPISAWSIFSQPLKLHEMGPALGEQGLDAVRIRARGSSRAPAATSSRRWSTVSWASFLLVPMTPDGPRLIQPAV